MNEPNKGGDPIQAIRNADNAAGEEQIAAVATALTGQDEPAPQPTPAPPPLPNAKRFDGFSQGLAGTLIAESGKLDRARTDLEQQRNDASSELDTAETVANAIRDKAIAAAQALYEARVGELIEKMDDNTKARNAITSALAALT